jgi:hypothetical protein
LCSQRDQLQNFLDNALAELENWLKANKRTKLNHVSQAIKYIYINLHIGYGNETIKFVIKTKFFGVQIDDNLIITYQAYVSIDVVQYALPWWQIQLLYIFISLCLFDLAFGAVG